MMVIKKEEINNVGEFESMHLRGCECDRFPPNTLNSTITPYIWLDESSFVKTQCRINTLTGEIEKNIPHDLVRTGLCGIGEDLFAAAGLYIHKVNQDTGELSPIINEWGSPGLLTRAGNYLIFRGNNYDHGSFLLRIDPQTSESLFLQIAPQSIIEDEIRSGPVFDGSFLWLPSGNTAKKLRKVDLNSMSIVETFENMPVWAGVYSNGFIWMASMNFNEGIFKIDPSNGAIVGNVSSSFRFNELINFNNFIYASGMDLDDNEIFCRIDPVDGSIVQSINFEVSNMIIIGDHVWACQGPKLHKFDQNLIIIKTINLPNSFDFAAMTLRSDL